MTDTDTDSGTTKLKQVMPSLTVGDIEASLAYYEGILGFTVLERWENDGALLGASVAAGDVSLMLGQDDWAQGRDRQKDAARGCPAAVPSLPAVL